MKESFETTSKCLSKVIIFDDVAFLILMYEHNYNVWKTMASYDTNNKNNPDPTKRTLTYSQAVARGVANNDPSSIPQYGTELTSHQAQVRYHEIIAALNVLEANKDATKRFRDNIRIAYRSLRGKRKERKHQRYQWTSSQRKTAF